MRLLSYSKSSSSSLSSPYSSNRSFSAVLPSIADGGRAEGAANVVAAASESALSCFFPLSTSFSASPQKSKSIRSSSSSPSPSPSSPSSSASSTKFQLSPTVSSLKLSSPNSSNEDSEELSSASARFRSSSPSESPNSRVSTKNCAMKRCESCLSRSPLSFAFASLSIALFTKLPTLAARAESSPGDAIGDRKPDDVVCPCEDITSEPWAAKSECGLVLSIEGEACIGVIGALFPAAPE